MISRLIGEVHDFDDDSAIINVGGVGYEVLCSTATRDALQALDSVELYIHTHVREDIFQLFGFFERNEKRLFLSLLKVNGIGPRSALNMLSASTWQKIIHLIESGDVKGLSMLPKIGKKTAEQIVLTLKGKLVFADQPHLEKSTSRREIVSALVHLGFKVNDVEKVVDRLDPKADVERGVRESLALLVQEI